MWLPLVRLKAFTGSDISRAAHQFTFHDREVKPNAVKAVPALHPKMTAHGQMASRSDQLKQTNQIAEQAQKAHAQMRQTHY